MIARRPWSIAFYKSSQDFTRPPAKVVPTSMLDTMPRLRHARGASTAGGGGGGGGTCDQYGNVDIWDDPTVWNPRGQAAREQEELQRTMYLTGLKEGRFGGGAEAGGSSGTSDRFIGE